MPLATVAHGLPYVNWFLLATLAVGSFAYVVLAREMTEATRGYLRFTAACSVVLAILALIADFGLPAPSGLVVVGAPPELDLARRSALGLVAGAGLLYPFVLRGGRPRVLIGLLGIGAGGAALVAAAVGWSATPVHAVPMALQLFILAAAAGGALATLILGHWYLVTPRLSERPLIMLTRVLTLVVGFQLVLFVVWTTLGGGPSQGPFDALGGGSVLFVGLRLVVGVFAFVLSWMAMRTAMTRSMESATGLLYIDLAAILAATIGAAALYVSAGLLV